MSLLDRFRKDTVVDLDACDDLAAQKYAPVGHMTSNQAIVYNELQDARHVNIIREGTEQAIRDLTDDVEKDVTAAQLAADWMTVKLGQTVAKHISADGHVLAQTNPSQANSTEATVAHARRFVRLYDRAGVPQSRVTIKVPSTLEGLRACKILGAEYGIHALGTMILSVEQGIAAGEEAKCWAVSPYCNPLEVHFVPGVHEFHENPVRTMPGMRITAQIQRQFKRRGVKTVVLAASLVTVEECVALSGVDRATIGIPMLELMSTTPHSPRLDQIREEAIASYEPTHMPEDEIPTDMRFPLEEPATALKAAFARPEVSEGMKKALWRFGEFEKSLLALAEQAVLAAK
ncbi:aldolase [Auriculariales sp. MPI-PUGE-AT-0066]|nr:aldolase [Auriculariales sp. MPI-PUGE-AT-0066]